MTKRQIIPPPADLKTKTLARLTRARRDQTYIIHAETIGRALFWPTVLTLVYGAAALFRLPQSLPDIFRSALSIIWVATLFTLVLRGVTRTRRPSKGQIDRRIEVGSALPPYALTLLEDRPSHPRHAAIWEVHLSRTLQRYNRLRPSLGRFGFSRKLTALLSGVLALNAAGIYCAGDHALSRLSAGFIPGTDDADTPLPEIQTWINSPSYDPRPPIYLNGIADTATVAPRAVLEAQVTGRNAVPWLTGAAAQDQSTRHTGPQSWHLKVLLRRSGNLVMRTRGRIIARWKIDLLPDPTPTVSWNGKPKIAPGSTKLTVPFEASQNFGIKSVSLLITSDKPYAGAGPVTYTSDNFDRKAEVVGRFREDVAQLPFAGESVTLRLKATSRSGRVTITPPKPFTLPAHEFADPINRALIDTRRRVLKEQESLSDADQDLTALNRLLVDEDKGLALLAYRLLNLKPRDKVVYARNLWAMAIYRDDAVRQGRAIADANLTLRAAQNALISLLQLQTERTPEAHSSRYQTALHAHVTAVQRAVDARMRILMFRAMLRSGIVPDPGAVTTGKNDAVTKLLRKVETQASRGDVKAALQQLARLDEMAQRLRDATPEEMAQAARQQSQDAQEQRNIAIVQDLIKRHTRLLDQAQARKDVLRQFNDENRENDFQRDPNYDLRAIILGAPNTTQPSASAALTDGAMLERAQSQDTRREAFQMQGALRHALAALIATIEGQNDVLKSLEKAHHDMSAVRHGLATRDDDGTAEALKQVIADLTQSGREMKAARRSKHRGEGPMILLPTMQPGQDSSGTDQDADGSTGERADGDATHNAKDGKDPLGRRVADGEGNSAADQKGVFDRTDKRRLEVERELRRRATNRTRPPREQQYLRDLLKAWRDGS